MGRKLLFATLLLLTVSFVTAESLFGFLQPINQSVEIPDFRGRREDGLDVPDHLTLQTEYRYDDTVPSGVVISQSPEAGSVRRVSERRPCEVTLTVSLGIEKRTVPSLAGLDARDAVARLRERGFSVSEQTVEATDDARGGTVARTDPPEGSELPMGSAVTVFVYGIRTQSTVAVPQLVGLAREQALLQLYLHGLHAKDVVEEQSEEVAGTVIRQSPPAGSYVTPGSEVRLVVSAAKKETEDTPSPKVPSSRGAETGNPEGS